MKKDIFSPKSIAIVGASVNQKGIGSVLLQNLINDGYEGNIYLVNPKYEEILGRKSYPDILSIEDSIDQVCIAIPSQAVEPVVDQCIEKKVKSIVIISAGFKEVGADGRDLENRIKDKVKAAGIRLLGPNCLGYINNEDRINLTFARKNPGNGSIAFISQSGAFCTAILDMAIAENLGFSHVISIGNKADIYENELIEQFEKDPQIDEIAIYLEQFTDGKEFVSLAQKSKKPIVVIAPGSSQKAKEAISSHTGSLASSHETVITALKKGNCIVVDSTEELFDTMKFVKNKKFPNGKNISVITNAGGPGVIAADNIEKEGLSLSNLSDNSKKKLYENLPEASAKGNPIDVLGDALADRYESAISTCIKDEGTDSILVILTPQLITDIVGTAEKIIKLQENTNKPIFACFLGKEDVSLGIDLLKKYNVYVSNNIESTVKLIRKITEYSVNRNKNKVVEVSDIKISNKYLKEIEDLITDEVSILPDIISENLLKEHNIPIPDQLITSNIDEAIVFAATKFPVVIKATSKDLAHKTDFKAIYLDIRTVTEFQEKLRLLRESITKVTRIASPDILIQEMIEPKVEFFLGANREGDSQIYEENGNGFGHLLAIGQGGIYTEVYKDIEYVLLPANREDILKSLDRTKVSKIIDGYRGKPKLAKDKLLDIISNIQSLLISYPQIVSMDINPIILTEDRAVAVDVKIYVKN
ncbi:MAG: acetate--CoA ligase family protein [Candidatus Dojkabacteria bacterium]|nr:acetate--CoA ligase family protein [Candidatus Dojkabacteria bacterium]